MTWRHELDPRRHLAAAIGWAVLGVVTLAALVTAQLAARQAEQRVRRDTERLLAEYATQVRDVVSMNLLTRRGALRATAAQVAAEVARLPQDPQQLQAALAAAQSQFPEFEWLGVADADGQLLAQVGPAMSGPVGAALWFQQGRQAPFVTDQHAPAGDPSAARLLDLAAPLPRGRVLGAFLSWRWLEGQAQRMQQALNEHRETELLLTARDGTVLMGPPRWLGQRLGAEADVTEGDAYLVGTRAQLRLAADLGLGWTAIVRQRTDLALAPARSTRHTVFVLVFGAGLAAAVVAALATRLLTRRLRRLAFETEAVRSGAQRALAAPAGGDEVARIGATLAELVDHLQADKQALQTLNAELDQRVAERTRRIERLADAARQAAVSRERLRIARDLHDTLAHSLMALLTQIRLVRKLHRRLDAEALDAELARAEEAAASGLAGSRAAIAQIRDNGIRDSGLGAALRELAQRFGERTGLPVALDLSADAGSANDERAETAFRIAEEALRNVERHAGARQVGLRLDGVRDEALHLTVEDDGQGFEPSHPPPGHYGLRGMHEQASLIGARLVVHSAPGQGTRIALSWRS